MKYIHQEELKKIQLNILDVVSAFCEDQGLSYFLGYGTLIGAIRHHGYIPWDDDIDIVMPRQDYDKFVQSFNDKNQIVCVVEHSLNRKYEIPFAKAYDSRTMMRETMYKETNTFGVYIDIFPLDGWGGREQLSKIKRLYQFLNAKKAVIDSQRSFKKNCIIALGKIALTAVSTSLILDKMDKTARSCNYETADKVKSFFSVYGEKEVCDKNLLKETILVDFEGKKYRVPANYDIYLRGIYGDYMKLPPEDKRQSTHVFQAWWK